MDASAELGAMVEFAAQHHGALTRRQAARFHISDYRLRTLLRRGLLTEPVAGVLLVAGSPPSFRRTAMATSLALRGRGALGELGAAHLLRFDGADEPPRELVAVIPEGCRFQPGSLPVRVVRTRAPLVQHDVLVVEGIRVTSFERTICDLAAHEGTARAGGLCTERMIDHYERTRRPLDRLANTAERLRANGRPGPPAVLAEIEQRRARRAKGERVRGSWFQRLVECCVASPVLGEVATEYEIRMPTGEFVARVDLAVPEVLLAVEAHSRTFHSGSKAEARDEHRENQMATLGWQTLYLGWDDTQHTPAQAAARVEATAEARRAQMGLPSRR